MAPPYWAGSILGIIDVEDFRVCYEENRTLQSEATFNSARDIDDTELEIAKGRI